MSGVVIYFFRDYKGAIKDIEKLDSLISYNIGYSTNGDSNLESIRSASKENLKYEILMRLILVFSQTDVSVHFNNN